MPTLIATAATDVGPGYPYQPVFSETRLYRGDDGRLYIQGGNHPASKTYVDEVWAAEFVRGPVQLALQPAEPAAQLDSAVREDGLACLLAKAVVATIKLPDGYNGHVVECDCEPLEKDGDSYKLHVTNSYLIKWCSRQQWEAAMLDRCMRP